MRLELVTAPASDLATVGMVRRWLSFVEGITQDDDVLQELIDEVTDDLEDQTNRKLRTQTWYVWLDEDEVTDTPIYLPVLPLASVSAITTYDDDASATTVTATNYLISSGENPRITLTDDGEWPTDMRDYDAMRVTCVCGYEDASYEVDVWFEPSDTNAPGADDLTAAVGTFSGTAPTTFEVQIDDADASPETFKWRKVTRAAGEKTYGAWTAGVAITGSAQTLADDVTVTFAATTGHTLDDQWNVGVYERLPSPHGGLVLRLLKGLILHEYRTKGTGVLETKAGQIIGMPRHFEAMIRRLRFSQ